MFIENIRKYEGPERSSKSPFVQKVLAIHSDVTRGPSVQLPRSMTSSRFLVDIHTHVYLPRYVTLLRNRAQVPRISSSLNNAGKEEFRLHILPNEPSGGRPVGPQVSFVFVDCCRHAFTDLIMAVLGQRGETQVHGCP